MQATFNHPESLTMKTLLAIFCAALALSGCASQSYQTYASGQQAIETARHQADAAKYKAMADIAATGDSAAKVAAVMAMALGQTVQGTQLATPVNEALQWASILVPSLTNVAGIVYNAKTAMHQSDNSAAVAVSTNSTFVGMAGRIQAPAANVTTTLSGTGNLGSGSYRTTDNHTVTPAPVVVAPVVPIVPVITPPVVITPVVQVVPVITPAVP